MSLEFNAENRNMNRSLRCCSFCRRAGHNISSCDSYQIVNFERICIINIIRDAQQNWRVQLREFLLNEALYNPNLVRAFAIRKCGATTRSNMDECIGRIQNFFEQQNNREERNIETRENLTFNSRNAIFPQNLLLGLMFMDMIMEMHNESERISRKFDIKTSVAENKDNLEEKCECSICYEDCENKNFVKLNCGHEFCKVCIKKTLQNDRRQTPCCAFCRTEIKNFEYRSESIANDFCDLIEQNNI